MDKFPKSQRRSWPFKDMEVDDVATFPTTDHRAQVTSHIYGRRSGKKFETRTVDGTLYVRRVS